MYIPTHASLRYTAQVEALSTALSVNVWSPSFNIESINDVWSESIPLQPDWPEEKLLVSR